jgi:nitrogen fixation protein NifU and related proteins
MYSAAVLERVRHPQRVGSLPAEAPDVGTGQAGTLDEGTTVRIQVRVVGSRVDDACFRVFGCSAAIASAALVAEWLDGIELAEAAGITAARVADHLSLPEDRRHVAALAAEAAERAVRDATGKQGRPR